MSPRVSVVISTFNSEKWLEACLQELRKQTFLHVCEVIIIDSGSNQDEAGVCRDFAALVPNLIYERTERETLYAAWNRGLLRARGEYFVNVNTDDALAPDAIEVFTRTMEKNSDVALAYADCVWSPVPNAKHPWPDSWKHVCYEPFSAETALFYCFTSCAQFWRVSALRSLGGFDPSLTAVGDYEALCRMVNNGLRAIHIPRILSAFYQNPDGLSQKSSVANDEFLRVRVRFRQDVDLSKVYNINTAHKCDWRGAYLALAVRSNSPCIPWHMVSQPDLEYASVNFASAASHAGPLRSWMIKIASMFVRSSIRFKTSRTLSRLLLSPSVLAVLNGRRLPQKL
jgi:glycosyltransferase involved in cell wall biosynthesis